MLFIAILILIFLMYRFFTFRAEMVFTMSLIAPIMIVIGACWPLFCLSAASLHGVLKKDCGWSITKT